MSESFNPYAPPAAQVEIRDQAGNVWRDGDLVVMEREGRLPSRCIRCNAGAAATRITRQLFWTPPLWRWSMLAVFLFLMGMTFLGSRVAFALFWPIALIAVIANALIRKKVVLDLPVCQRHRRIDTVLSLAALAGLALFVALFVWAIGNHPVVFLGMLGLMFALGMAHTWSGARAIALARVSDTHVWVKRAGKPFRTSLPQSPAGMDPK